MTYDYQGDSNRSESIYIVPYLMMIYVDSIIKMGDDLIDNKLVNIRIHYQCKNDMNGYQ